MHRQLSTKNRILKFRFGDENHRKRPIRVAVFALSLASTRGELFDDANWTEKNRCSLRWIVRSSDVARYDSGAKVVTKYFSSEETDGSGERKRTN